MGWILSFALAVSIGVLLVLRKLAAQASRSRIAQLELDAARQAAWLQTKIDRLTADNDSLAKFTQFRYADS
jgi:hypothetical protein